MMYRSSGYVKTTAWTLMIALVMTLLPAFAIAASIEGGVTGIMPTMPVNPYADVLGTDWFIDDVIFVFDQGLMSGTSTEPMLFSPDVPMTRSMAVNILWKLRGSPMLADYQNPYSDVDWQGEYFYAVLWASASKIVNGFGDDRLEDGRFGPEDALTREQMAAVLLEYELHMDQAPRDILMDRMFSDWDEISIWARNAVNRLTIQGILGGRPGNLFDPQGVATRAEFAAVLTRYVKAIGYAEI